MRTAHDCVMHLKTQKILYFLYEMSTYPAATNFTAVVKERIDLCNNQFVKKECFYNWNLFENNWNADKVEFNYCYCTRTDIEFVCGMKSSSFLSTWFTLSSSIVAKNNVNVNVIQWNKNQSFKYFFAKWNFFALQAKISLEIWRKKIVNCWKKITTDEKWDHQDVIVWNHASSKLVEIWNFRCNKRKNKARRDEMKNHEKEIKKKLITPTRSNLTCVLYIFFIILSF